jgi:hypothetical protein
MNVRYSFLVLTGYTPLRFCVGLFLGAGVGSAQTYDFGYVPIAATNQQGGFNFANGTNKFMA